MGWVRNVVLMSVYFGSGKPQGVGILGSGPDGQMRKYRGQFTSDPRKRWTDPVTARRVPSKWKGKQGEQGGQGEQGEQGEQGNYRVHNLSILCIYQNDWNV
jgi:hypothetical protein